MIKDFTDYKSPEMAFDMRRQFILNITRKMFLFQYEPQFYMEFFCGRCTTKDAV